MDSVDFLQEITKAGVKGVKRGVALLWFLSLRNHEYEAGAGELTKIIEAAGLGQQNASRLRRALQKEKHIVKGRNGAFRIHLAHRPDLDAEYLSYVGTRPVPESESVLPVDLFCNARGYIQKVIAQLNASYEYSLFDCCAVMCRRLLETLIIECYEACSRADELKDGSGHFKMFSGLLSHIERDPDVNLSRNATRGLRNFKKLGDLSAHNRRFNAHASDIDKISHGLRVAAEELLYLANQGP